MPDGFTEALRMLPDGLREAAEAFPGARLRAEELRLRAGYAPTVLIGAEERPLRAPAVTEELLRDVLDRATESSFHAVADELRHGYLAARGGVRVGVCGTAATDGGVRALREVSSLAIRIPRQLREAGRDVIPQLTEASVLVLSPPGAGKTTFLRELVRTLSDGGRRVGLADERGEVAAVWHGRPQFDVGRSTDVVTGAPKAEAAMLLLRSMNPRLIALDEISDPADAEAVARINGCGVRILATVHAAGTEALKKRPLLRRLTKAGAFQKAVVITAADGRRSYRVEDL